MRLKFESARTYMDALCPIKTDIIGDSMTRQDQAEMVNINNIYAKTQRGEIVLGSTTKPTFGDFSDNGTYDVMLETIMAAEDAFMELPASERKKYNHDPAVYYEKTMEDATSQYTEQQKHEANERAKAKKAAEVEKARKLVKENPEPE